VRPVFAAASQIFKDGFDCDLRSVQSPLVNLSNSLKVFRCVQQTRCSFRKRVNFFAEPLYSPVRPIDAGLRLQYAVIQARQGRPELLEAAEFHNA